MPSSPLHVSPLVTLRSSEWRADRAWGGWILRSLPQWAESPTYFVKDLSSGAGQTSVFCSNNGIRTREAPMAGNELAASFNWTDNQLTQLTFSRSGTPISFTEHKIDLNF